MLDYNLAGVKHHPALVQLTDLLCNQTQNQDRDFFSVLVAYHFSKMASTMGAIIKTLDRGDVPVNMYALLLATSGYGKGHSVFILEDLLKGFRKAFVEETLPTLAERSLAVMAAEKAIKNQSDETEEMDKLWRDYRALGAYPFTFDSGTVPAVKQLRQKILMAKAGSVNLQIDEIGSNLLGNQELLNVFLELYDQGMVKPKLVKNTAENQRAEDIEGRTPSNLLMFGTPSKLFDGGQTENLTYDVLEAGYGRRSMFAMGTPPDHTIYRNPEEIFKRLINPQNGATSKHWQNKFRDLAHEDMYGFEIEADYAVGVELMTYKLACEAYAASLPSIGTEIRKAEISHRYFRALKLAGAYAFIDQSAVIDIDEHLKPAMLLVEQSGEAFTQIMNREKPHVRLAKFIVECETEVTHADLMEALPFYPRAAGPRSDMINLAIAHCYRNNMIIKKTFADGVDIFTGEKLKETDLDSMILSWSQDWTYSYRNSTPRWDQLHKLCFGQDLHFINHHLLEGESGLGHRTDKNIIVGFNMVAIDIDGTATLDQARQLLSKYKYLIYTTKSHDDDAEHRFRIIFPTNYQLKLNQDDYKKFMNSIMEWLPFESDTGANQRARKWASCNSGFYEYNEGELLDVLDFIPKTSRNEAHNKSRRELTSYDKLESWFASQIADGNRNNMLHRFAMTLVDSGMNYDEVEARVFDFNGKLSEPLEKDELLRTVLVSVAKSYEP